MPVRNLNQVVLMLSMCLALLNPVLAQQVVIRDVDYLSGTDYAEIGSRYPHA